MNREEGQFEAWANAIARSADAEDKADTHTISRAVQHLLGGQTYRAGSLRKGTAIIGSDLDLCVETVKPVTVSERRELARQLESALGRQARPLSHVIRVAGAARRHSIDVAFARAEFGSRPLPDPEPFRALRLCHAARALKWWLSRGEFPWVGGWVVEGLVLELDARQLDGLALFERIVEWLATRANPSAVEAILRPHAAPTWHPEWSDKLPGRLEAIGNAARAIKKKRPTTLHTREVVQGWLTMVDPIFRTTG